MMKKNKTYNYGVFILTHGRPDNVTTTHTLRRCGYNGQIYYVLETKDKTIEKYKENFGEENIVIFNKDDVKETFDIMDNQDDDRCVVYARNEVFNIAKKLNFKYFIVLDDDYGTFIFRFNKEYKYIGNKKVANLESIFQSMIKYMDNTKIYSLCFAQGGDFINGSGGSMAKAIKTKRKAMNLFVLSTERPFQFTGRLNEDVNAYIRHGILGKIMLTTTQISLNQKITQTNSGGLTDIYLASGTYVKSFYSVMCSPSSVKINLMGNKHRRLHHVIRWNNTVPKIINDKYKK